MVAVTRFNDHTWGENKAFREKQNYQGCLYNTPKPIACDVPSDSLVFVLEMNNTQRKILGVGLIHNHLRPQRLRVYSDDYYNRFTYYSKERVGRDELTREEQKIITVLEELVFYGPCHLQRGRGIQKLPLTISQCECVLRSLGENMARRGNIAAAKARLQEGNVDKEWIYINKGLNLVTWLCGVFRSRFDISSS